MTFNLEEMTKELFAEPLKKWNCRTFNGLGKLLPEDQDPDVTFRNNWLSKGQSFGLVAGSGIGKSSLSVQMSYHWALGRAMFAIPMRPLKIAIIQAEDSERDLKEQRNGMLEGLRTIEGWTDDEIEAADANIVLPDDFIGRSGENFMNLLRDFQGDTHQDVLFINPLQSFFGGDVSSQEDAYKFANGIDEIIKHPDMKCNAGIVMHTAKWKSGKKDDRQDVSDFAEYMMAGSHAWTDWLRAIFAFQKHGDSEVYFDLKAAKRGKRLGWKDADGNPTTTKIMKHTEGFIYWQEVTDPNELAAIPEPEPKAAGRKPKDELDVIKAAHACATNYAAECRGKAADAFAEHFWKINNRKYTKASWRLVFNELVDNSEDYGFSVEEITSGNKKKMTVLM